MARVHVHGHNASLLLANGALRVLPATTRFQPSYVPDEDWRKPEKRTYRSWWNQSSQVNV